MDKICTKCGESKDVSCFNKCVSGKDGLRPDCRQCRNKAKKEYRERNKDKVSAYSKEYARRGYVKEKRKIARREWEGRMRECLGDRYIKKKLSEHSLISYGGVPQTLVEAKRVQLKIKRYLDEVTR